MYFVTITPCLPAVLCIYAGRLLVLIKKGSSKLKTNEMG